MPALSRACPKQRASRSRAFLLPRVYLLEFCEGVHDLVADGPDPSLAFRVVPLWGLALDHLLEVLALCRARRDGRRHGLRRLGPAAGGRRLHALGLLLLLRHA